MCRKSSSEHNFSGVYCNFRVFRGIFPGAHKIQGFSGSSRVCGPSCDIVTLYVNKSGVYGLENVSSTRILLTDMKICSKQLFRKRFEKILRKN